MHRPVILSIPALVLATSCLPQPGALTVAAVPATVPARPVKDPRELLRRLDLVVPTDVLEETALARVTPPSPLRAAPAFDAGAQSADDAARALDCLTQAVYYEARSEPLDGERAVAQVVLNRVRDRAFPRSVCGVVYQGSERRTGCQFSFTCDGSLDRPREPVAWARARAVAAAALGGEVYAPVGSATHYHADYVQPWWASSLTRIGAIGAHIFYRWRNAMENALAFRDRYDGSEPAIPAPGGGGGDIAGITIHRGDAAETVGSVTIHRNGTAAPTAAPAAAGLTPIALTKTRPLPRSTTSAGVRIHRDIAGPDDDSAGDAVVSGDIDAI